MIRQLQLSDQNEAVALHTLQRIAYRVEADMIGFDGIPPLHETLEALQTCGESFHGYFEGSELVGAVSYERIGEVVTICRLVVNPDHFRKHIGERLLQSVLEMDGEVFRVSTGTKNLPAKMLYLKNGFQEMAEIQVAAMIFVTKFERQR